jgi:hypothetical protein
MSQLEQTGQASDGPESRWQSPLTWLGLVAVAWVLFELTYQPAVGTAVICLKFAGEDLRTANWLRRYDPHRTRGWACWWLYVAFGLLKAAGVGALTEIVMLASLMRLVGGPGQDRIYQASIGAAVLVTASLSLTFLAGAVAVEFARRARVRLWLDGVPGVARRRGFWPPCKPKAKTDNLLVGLLFIGGMPVLFGWLLVVVITLLDWKLLGVAGEGIAAFLIWGPVGLFYLRARDVVARSPYDCWSATELPAEG